jgi:hypothetical protein
MRLVDLLDRCLTLEKRAAAVYRRYGAAPGAEAQLWAELAADEAAHARSIREARRSLVPDDRGIAVDGCEAALADVERRLAEAETLPAEAGQDRRLIAALNIELSEIEALRQLAIRAVGHPRVPDQDHAHLRRLADAARRRSDSDQVRLAVALLLARERLCRCLRRTDQVVSRPNASSLLQRNAGRVGPRGADRLPQMIGDPGSSPRRIRPTTS